MITNLVYWMAILAASCFGPPLGIALATGLIPDHTDAMAGFYIPISFLFLPVFIPLCSIAIFFSIQVAIVARIKDAEESRQKYAIAIPPPWFGAVMTVCGSLLGCMFHAKS